MLSTSQRMAKKLAEAIARPPITQSKIAAECKVTKQAVQGWLKTGRFDKKHLPKLSEITGRPLSWWLDSSEGTLTATETGTDSFSATGTTDDLLHNLQDWRLQASSKSQEVLDQLTLLAKKNMLRDEDWQLIEQITRRFMRK